MVFVGRSCSIVPPLSEVVWHWPSSADLSVTVPAVTDEALSCFVARLAAARPVRVVFFGSSVTAGIRCVHKKQRSVSFPQQVQQLLAHRYPQSNATFDVYGYPGASPSFMRACHTTLMRTDAADLYVLEMTDNLSDGYGGVGHSIEALMSAVRQRAPAAALVLLAPIPQRCVRSLKRMKPFHHVPHDDDSTRGLLATACYDNRSVAASFEDVGTAHQLATVSARRLIREQLWRDPANAARLIGRLHYDAVHPSGEGHWQLATALDFAIGRHGPSSQLAAASSKPVCAAAPVGALERSNLFAPRVPVPSGSMVCALGDDLKQYVLRSSGWRYTLERNSQGLPRPGYVAEQPGATLDLCYRPTLRREQLSSKQSVVHSIAWSLGYLMSYERMGQMRGECLRSESSCTCGARVFNGHWRLPISQPHISRLKLAVRYARRNATGPLLPEMAMETMGNDRMAIAACPCIIRLTLLNTTDSKAHKMKLVSLMSGFYTGTIVSDAVGWASRYGIM